MIRCEYHFHFGLVFTGFYIFQLDVHLLEITPVVLSTSPIFNRVFLPELLRKWFHHEMIVLLLDVIFFLFTRSQKAGESVMFRENICPKCVRKNVEKCPIHWFREICLYIFVYMCLYIRQYYFFYQIEKNLCSVICYVGNVSCQK